MQRLSRNAEFVGNQIACCRCGWGIEWRSQKVPKIWPTNFLVSPFMWSVWKWERNTEQPERKLSRRNKVWGIRALGFCRWGTDFHFLIFTLFSELHESGDSLIFESDSVTSDELPDFVKYWLTRFRFDFFDSEFTRHWFTWAIRKLSVREVMCR